MKFKSDTVSALEDMAGATAIDITSSVNSSSLTYFPSDFTFRYGLDTFNSFSVSAFGFIKLGAEITSILGESQDSSIAVFSVVSSFTSYKYKLIGSAPTRILVVEWGGTFNPTFQAIKFQLLLHETSGKIQMVYSGNNSYSSGNQYKILLRQNFYGLKNMVSVDVRNGEPPMPVYKAFLNTVGYFDASEDNRERIPAFQRYTFQPNTVAPLSPTIAFHNIMPGCMDIEPQYSVTDASYSVIERQNVDGSFSFLSLLEHGDSYYDTLLYADTTYRYRSWLVNGFVNSDTVEQTKLMPLPLINGIKMIPGDYPTITALLEDAKCKQLGPELVIELQTDYNFQLEPGTVNFTSRFRSPGVKHVIIRPASGASLVLEGANKTMFYIDSMCHVEFDGRQGGTGSDASMVIRQTSSQPSIVYTNAADSGSIRYCIFQGNSQNSSGMVLITGRDKFLNPTKLGCNGITISHCKFGPPSGTIYTMIVAEGNMGRGSGLVIEHNEFFRFERQAIQLRYLIAPSVRYNRFYQPPNVFQSGGPAISASFCGIAASVEYNRFGGSSPAWGIDTWNSSASGSYNFIDAVGGLTVKGNEFANINVTANSLNVIAVRGPSLIRGNIIGSKDSVGSIKGVGNVTIIRINPESNSRIDSNVVGGIAAGNNLVFCDAFDLNNSNIVISDNDFGGSDDYDHNTSGLWAYPISASSRNLEISNNKVRGITAMLGGIYGIDVMATFNTTNLCAAAISNNQIHHLQARQTLYGVNARPDLDSVSSVTGNTIYALRAIGPSAAFGANQPAITCGIKLHTYPFLESPTRETVAEVSNNYIHSFDYLTPEGLYYYDVKGLDVNSRNTSKVYNNVIRLGLNTKGLEIDTSEAYVTAMQVGGIQVYIESNSIYLGGTGGTGIHVDAGGYLESFETAYVLNNIIQIDKTKKRTFDDPNIYMMQTLDPYVSTTMVANNNIWYSAQDPFIASAFATWQANCNCDQNSNITDPMFVNPTGDSLSLDMHLQSGSPADGFGTASVLPIVLDKDSLNRADYSPVDVGAFAITPCAAGGPVVVSVQPSDSVVRKCAGVSVSLSATVTGSIISMNWQKNLVDIPGATSNSISVVDPGSYRLVVKFLCGQTASSSVFVKDTVMANMFTSITAAPGNQVCPGTPVTLTANTPGCINCTYTWNTGEVTPTITIVNGGNYIVTSNSGCGTATASQNITFKPVPVVTASATPEVICINGSSVLKGNGANEYLWSPASSLNQSNGSIVTAYPEETTTYTVIGTTNGCSDTAEVVVTVANPEVSLNPESAAICQGESIQLTATGTGNLTWTPSSGLNVVTGSVVTASPSVTTEYTVHSNISTCSDSATVIVEVLPTVMPTIDISYSGCSSGTPAFIAQTTNAGVSGVVHWFVNDIHSGSGSSFILDNATNGTQVYARLISDVNCASPDTVVSSTITINCIPTSVSGIEGIESVSILPNPGKGLFNVKLKLLTAKAISYRILSQSGSTVYYEKMTHYSGTVNKKIDLRSVADGIYYLRIMAEGKEISYKLVVIR